MKFIITILLACLGIFYILLPPPTQEEFDGGGDVRTYSKMVDEYNKHHVHVSIRGTCASACLMKLGAKDVCVDPTARLLFHQASWTGTTIKSPIGNAIMMRKYPKHIKEWVLRHNALESHELTPMSGIEAIALGVRPCPLKD